MVSLEDAAGYLKAQLADWPVLGSRASGLYATSRDRPGECGTYSNGMLATALLTLDPLRADAHALRILQYFYERFKEMPEEVALLAPSYGADAPADQEPAIADTAMVLIAMGKFCVFHKKHPSRVRFGHMLDAYMGVLGKLSVSCGLVAYTTSDYVCTGTTALLYSLASICTGITHPSSAYMLRHTNNFCEGMYYQTDENRGDSFAAYRAGVYVSDSNPPSCDIDDETPQTPDPSVWVALAAADHDETRIGRALSTVCRDFLNAQGAVEPSESAMQMTAAFLCALPSFKTDTQTTLRCAGVDRFLRDITKTVKAGTAMPTSFAPGAPAADLTATTLATLAACANAEANPLRLPHSQVMPVCDPSAVYTYRIFCTVLSICLVLAIIAIVCLSLMRNQE